MRLRDLLFWRSRPVLREYLHVDEVRLNSYLEQISATSTYDKVPSLKWGISSLGPSASGEQTRHLRPKTNHEKISELIDYLERQGYLGHTRPNQLHGSDQYLPEHDFVAEECDAVKVLVPRADHEMASAGGVVVWISEWPIERRQGWRP